MAAEGGTGVNHSVVIAIGFYAIGMGRGRVVGKGPGFLVGKPQ